MAKDSDGIGLADLIQQVKTELLKVEGEPNGQRAAPLLMLEEVQLELRVTVSAKVNGGVNIHVVQLGGGAQRDDVHTVSVKLQPILTHAERVAELHRDGRWPDVVKAALEGTVKGPAGESLIDQ